jgi:uncharacterized membrane protein
VKRRPSPVRRLARWVDTAVLAVLLLDGLTALAASGPADRVAEGMTAFISGVFLLTFHLWLKAMAPRLHERLTQDEEGRTAPHPPLKGRG